MNRLESLCDFRYHRNLAAFDLSLRRVVRLIQHTLGKLSPNIWRDVDGLNLLTGLENATSHDDLPVGDNIIANSKFYRVRHTAITDSPNSDVNLDSVFKSSRFFEIALSRHARPTKVQAFMLANDAHTQFAEHLVFCLFHHLEEAGKVHDSAGIRLTEFDSARGGERKGFRDQVVCPISRFHVTRLFESDSESLRFLWTAN